MKYSTFIINKKHKLYKKYLNNLIFISIIIIILIAICPLYLKNIFVKTNYIYYISEKGNDDNIGNKDNPLQALMDLKTC